MKVVHHSVFKGTLGLGNNDGWLTLTLKSDKNDFRIDLVDRLKEVIMNIDMYKKTFKMYVYLSDTPQPFKNIDNNWTKIVESNYVRFSKTSTDVQYFEDWHDTKYDTYLKIGDFDMFDFLKAYRDKWVYIKFDLIEKP